MIVSRLRLVAGAKDRHNNPTAASWATSDLEAFAFDPGGSSEPIEVGRAPVVTQPTLYFRTEPDLTARDRVVVDGVTYLVTGKPAVWRSPYTGELKGVVAHLKVVDG